MAQPPALPVPLAMVVCDAVWRDPGSGKHFLLGCFSAIGAREFPTVHPNLAVYLALTDGYGALELRLALAEPGGRIVHESQVQVEFPDPRTIVEIAVAVQNLTFAGPGEHRLQLWGGSSFIMERRILVQDLRQARLG